MPKTLIEQKPKIEGIKILHDDKLAIAEMFCDTLQGEGINTGVVSTFIRLQGCTLQCTWCDTLDVWPHGNEYSFNDIFGLFESNGLIDKFSGKDGTPQHLIFTGGSPLKQQKRIVQFIDAFMSKYGFKPYIEIENECVLIPNEQMLYHVDCWNNSPKLSNSGMRKEVRIKPTALQITSGLTNSWFKFVIQSIDDWNEIQNDFINTGLIKKNQIILMPEGINQEELNNSREIVADIAIQHNVRFTDRLHITIWNKKTGV